MKGSRCHKHNVAEIVFATEGSSLVSCGGTVRRVNAPYIVYCPAEVPHQQDNSGGPSYTRWCFPIFLTDIGESAGLPNQFLAVELNDFQCRQFTIYAEALYSFWGCREYNLPAEQQNTSPHDLLRLKYLLLLFLNDLRPLIPTLADIAGQCGFSSVSYFIKVFTRYTGLSPTRYRMALDELPSE